MRLPTYEAYKDSGFEWLQRVPSHWKIKRLRFVANLNPSKAELAEIDRATDVSFLPMEAIGDDGSINVERTRPISEVETGYTYFRDGDVTIAKITPCFENGKGALMRGLEAGIGFGTTELIVARPKPSEVLGSFLNWTFRSPNFRSQGEASMYGAGGQKRVPDDFVRDFSWSFPPLIEQSAISDFLDRETAKIDALIAEQEKLLTLLAEKRQATISHAVTKGLNPDVPMKDSGVEWLGEVPEHWGHSKKLLDLVTSHRHSFVNGPFGSDLLTSELTYEGVPVVYIRDIKESGYIRISEWCVTKEKATQLSFCNVLPGDLVVAKVGDPPGMAAIYPEGEPEGVVTQDVIRLRLDSAKSYAGYVRWVLNSNYGQTAIDQISVESTRTRVGLGEYKQLRFFIPPVHEQREISDFLDNEIRRLNALAGKASSAIDLLKERRGALISAAVTGQIDVSNAVPEATTA